MQTLRLRASHSAREAFVWSPAVDGSTPSDPGQLDAGVCPSVLLAGSRGAGGGSEGAVPVQAP